MSDFKITSRSMKDYEQIKELCEVIKNLDYSIEIDVDGTMHITKNRKAE